MMAIMNATAVVPISIEVLNHRRGRFSSLKAQAPTPRIITERLSLKNHNLDTIGSLKARIKERFSLTDNDLNQRLLVPDNREDYFNNSEDCFKKTTLINTRNLMEEDEGSLLLNLKDGDQLNLGWNVPFTINLAGIYVDHKMSTTISVMEVTNVSCYDTVGELKKKIEKITLHPVKEDNLPQVFFSSSNVDKQTLLSFGLYSRFEQGAKFIIYLNRYNSLSYGIKQSASYDYNKDDENFWI